MIKTFVLINKPDADRSKVFWFNRLQKFLNFLVVTIYLILGIISSYYFSTYQNARADWLNCKNDEELEFLLHC